MTRASAAAQIVATAGVVIDTRASPRAMMMARMPSPTAASVRMNAINSAPAPNASVIATIISRATIPQITKTVFREVGNALASFGTSSSIGLRAISGWSVRSTGG
jgi:hypothetical protein